MQINIKYTVNNFWGKINPIPVRGDGTNKAQAGPRAVLITCEEQQLLIPGNRGGGGGAQRQLHNLAEEGGQVAQRRRLHAGGVNAAAQAEHAEEVVRSGFEEAGGRW